MFDELFRRCVFERRARGAGRPAGVRHGGVMGYRPRAPPAARQTCFYYYLYVRTRLRGRRVPRTRTGISLTEKTFLFSPAFPCARVMDSDRTERCIGFETMFLFFFPEDTF